MISMLGPGETLIFNQVFTFMEYSFRIFLFIKNVSLDNNNEIFVFQAVATAFHLTVITKLWI